VVMETAGDSISNTSPGLKMGGSAGQEVSSSQGSRLNGGIGHGGLEGKIDDCKWGPLPQSVGSAPETGGGGVERAGATGAKEAPGLGGGVGEGKQKTIHSSHILKVVVPVGTSITAPAVARNGRPKIRGLGSLCPCQGQ